ncbi:MAG: hypothetical protein EBR34_10665 [Sphingomonadaceae bacterium]|nr:hypothetical protein [Sphingomonadaceae bacterium]
MGSCSRIPSPIRGTEAKRKRSWLWYDSFWISISIKVALPKAFARVVTSNPFRIPNAATTCVRLSLRPFWLVPFSSPEPSCARPFWPGPSQPFR